MISYFICLQGKGRAVLVPPQWIWEGFAQFAPDAAEVACNALDILSAARYFEVHSFNVTCHHRTTAVFF